ncbi:hypothetical protein Bca4012_101026 [Brassica carinata]
MARFSLLCFLFAAALTSSLTSCSDSTARSAMDSLLELPSRRNIFSLAPIVPFSILHAIIAASRSMRSSPPLASCDRRRLSLNRNIELVVFRPKVDEITLLTINTSSSSSSYCPVHSRLSDL